MPLSGEEIRRIRQSLGLTQVQFAELLGTIGNTVAKWERDEATPREPTVKLIQLVAVRTEILDEVVPKRARKAAKTR